MPTDRHILLLDDDPSLLDLVSIALTEQGYRVSRGANGLEGIELVRKDPPDLIIADVIMPKMGGYEFTRLIRRHEEHRQIPVIILSSSIIDEVELEKALSSGADEVLAKIDPSATSLNERVVEAVEKVFSGQIQDVGASALLEQQSPEALKKLVRELLNQKHWNEQIVENVGRGILLIDASQKAFYANSRGLDILQMSAEEVVGRSLYDFELSLGKPTLERLLRQVIEDGTGRISDLIVPYFDRLLQLVLVPLFDEHQRYLGSVVSFDEYPLTLELERIRKEMNFNVQERMDALSESLNGLVEMIDQGQGAIHTDAVLPLVSEARDELWKVQEMARQLNSQAMAVRQTNAIDLRTVAFEPFLQNLVDLVRSEADRKGINILFDAPANDLLVRVDPATTFSVFFIVLDLLIKLAASLSDLVVESEAKSEFVVVRLRVTVDPDGAEKYIQRDDPFSRFYEKDGRLEVSNSKLCVVRELVDLQGGMISFWHDQGNTEIKVVFKRGEERRNADRGTAGNKKRLGKPTVLVLRGEKDQAFPQESDLQRSGFGLHPVSSLGDIKRELDGPSDVQGIVVDLFGDHPEPMKVLADMAETVWTRSLPILVQGTLPHNGSYLNVLDGVYPYPPNYSQFASDLQRVVGASSDADRREVLLVSPSNELRETIELILDNDGYRVQVDYSIEEVLNVGRLDERFDAILIDGSQLNTERLTMLRYAYKRFERKEQLRVFLLNFYREQHFENFVPITTLQLENRLPTADDLARLTVATIEDRASTLGSGRGEA